MGKRLTAIATRTGDDGTTGLGDGTRTRKDTLRVAAMGDVDELNSSIGVLLTEPMPDPLRADLIDIQHHLFDLGGELSIPGYSLIKEAHVAASRCAAGALQRRPAEARGIRVAGWFARGRIGACQPHRVPPG